MKDYVSKHRREKNKNSFNGGRAELIKNSRKFHIHIFELVILFITTANVREKIHLKQLPIPVSEARIWVKLSQTKKQVAR